MQTVNNSTPVSIHHEQQPEAAMIDSSYCQAHTKDHDREMLSNDPLEEGKRKKPLKHYVCCICCPCLPMWMRYSCCILFIIIVILLIVVGVLAAVFKVPSVEFNGTVKHPDGYPQFEKANNSLAFNVSFGLDIGVINDNVENIALESIRAIAYYSTAPKIPVGGGVIYDVHIKSFGITNFTFPFSINYDPQKDGNFAMLTDIVSKCGLLEPSKKEDLYIEYDLIPTIRIAGIGISPVVHQSSHFPCPISAGQLAI
ncbi:MAG: hypothetical protein EXX96DRAFT_567078 [Benjaminiella poitrasii]|nr:MAG: hypothetical protein EXX96DRAFT_567078 [Benjaminiella poitrasii]